MEHVLSATPAQTLRTGKRQRFVRKKIFPWLFILPALLINVVVIVGPSISSLFYSLTDWNGITSPNFIGLANFQRIFRLP